jgi:hypothetical protein
MPEHRMQTNTPRVQLALRAPTCQATPQRGSRVNECTPPPRTRTHTPAHSSPHGHTRHSREGVAAACVRAHHRVGFAPQSAQRRFSGRCAILFTAALFATRSSLSSSRLEAAMIEPLRVTCRPHNRHGNGPAGQGSMPLTQEEIDGCREAFMAFDKVRVCCVGWVWGWGGLAAARRKFGDARNVCVSVSSPPPPQDRSGTIDVWELRLVLEGAWRAALLQACCCGCWTLAAVRVRLLLVSAGTLGMTIHPCCPPARSDGAEAHRGGDFPDDL